MRVLFSRLYRATSGNTVEPAIEWTGGGRLSSCFAVSALGYSMPPLGWTLPPQWDAVAGDYQASDGWIRLHTNAPHLAGLP